MIYQLKREQTLRCSIDQAWSFFSTPRNLDRLTPDSVGFKITHCTSEIMHQGQMIAYKVKVAPLIWVRWLTEITSVDDHESFIDEQRLGPYKIWHHIHRFEAQGDEVLMTDEVTYVMPFGILGKVAHALFVKRKLQHIFDERQRLTDAIFSGENASAS
jgi:ligand-binding SRPBCC domain-containing protein